MPSHTQPEARRCLERLLQRQLCQFKSRRAHRSKRNMMTPTAGSTRQAPSSKDLYELYKQDRLLLHTMPTNSIPERPQRIKDKASLVCSSILFFHGITNRPTGIHLDNAVARFGERTKILDTVFGTLHDLKGVWATHRELEAKKADDIRGEWWCWHAGLCSQPFLFFTNCDMCDVAKASGGLPDDTYTQARWQETPPVQFQRTQGFDFRRHCEDSKLKDDTSKHALHCEWNELRAALNADNMVGLAYIHDPTHDPHQHLEAAHELRQRLEDAGDTHAQQYIMAVFQLEGEAAVSGKLLVDETCSCTADIANDTKRPVGDGWCGQLLTFEDYLAQIPARPKGAAKQ